MRIRTSFGLAAAFGLHFRLGVEPGIRSAIQVKQMDEAQ
jgi:hypothetical protein